jgi:hypothetical protein
MMRFYFKEIILIPMSMSLLREQGGECRPDYSSHRPGAVGISINCK